MNNQSIILSGLLFVFSLTSGFSQSEKKGEIIFQGGVGVLPTYFMDGGSTNVLPVQASLSYKFNGLISVGAFGGYSSSESKPSVYKDGSVHQFQNQNFIFGIRSAVHAKNFEKFDIYGGVNFGYNMPAVNVNTITYGEDAIPVSRATDEFIYGAFVGFTGYLNQNFGLFAEMGYGISLLQAGVTVRL
jgi:hypothetical protein